MTMTPYLALVLAGFAVFMGVLGIYWARSFVESVNAARAKVD